MERPPSSQEVHEELDPATFLLDAAGRVVGANDVASRLVGRAATWLVGRSLGEVFMHGHAPASAWLTRLGQAAEPIAPRVLDLELERPDGSRGALEGILYGIRAGRSETNEAVAGMKIRPSVRVEARSEQLSAQRELIEMVAGGSDLRAILQRVAAFAERSMPGETFCLLTPVGPDSCMQEGLAPTLPADIGRLQAGHRLGEDWSPATVAGGSGESLVALDLEHLAAWHAFRESIGRHGLIACWVQPVSVGRPAAVRAVLEFLLPIRRPPSRSERALLEELGALVRIAIELHDLGVSLRERSVAQQAAEADAERRRRSFEALVDTALDAVVGIDSYGFVTLWNRMAEQIFGWRSDEVLGKPLSHFIIPAELIDAHEAGMQRWRETGFGRVLGKRLEIPAVDRNGRRFPVELAINEIPGSQGMFSAFLRDISERKRIEETLRDSESRMKMIVEASSDGFWDIDLAGGASFFSERCAEILGHAPPDLPARVPPEHPWVHPGDVEAVRQAWGEHLAGRTARYESEHRRRHADGTWRWILERGRVVERSADGSPQRVVGSQTDVTERHAMADSLRSVERLEGLGLLAAGVVHELETRLSVMRAHVSLIASRGDLEPEIRRDLDRVQAEITHAKAIAQGIQILAPSQEDAAVQRIGVVEAIRSVMRLLRPSLPRSVQVAVEDRSGGRDGVRADPARLHQAVVHLVLRGSEMVAHAGALVLRVTSDGSCVRLECVDSGRPLPPEAAARVFEASEMEGAPLGRMALGMAAVRRFAESLGGRVLAQTTSEGNMVGFELPIAMQEAGGDRPEVLLLEPDALERAVRSGAMAAAGHRVHGVDRLEAAEAALAAASARVVAVLPAEAWLQCRDRWSPLIGDGGQLLGVLVVGAEGTDLTCPPGVRLLRRPAALSAILAELTALGGV
jgi:PAS domain S-box-containing protein